VTRSAKPVKPVKLTFGVFGTQDEVTAYQRVANSYNAVTDESDVTLTPYGSESDLVAGLRDGTVPDVFLVSRGDLPFVQDAKLNRPLSGLLDERGVDFGDGYSRDALEAFSFDRDIQCMPYGISPDVVYYNKRWIDFDKMLARGLPAPTIDPEDTRTSPRWSFTGFEAAAQFGTRPRRGIAGVYVDPTLRGLAPFIYSGGGDVFDDDDNPTSLALSDGSSRDALGAVLPLLRNPELTLSADQLAQASPLQWFKRGKLAMIVGTRDLVPRLRGVEGLDFDVMPMPVVDDAATVGDVTGICLSAKAADTDEAADFLVHAISAESVGQVVQAGALAPANQAVALSDTFLQPDQLPVHSSVFVSSVRDMVVPPLLPQRQELSDLVSADVRLLFTTPVLDPDLEALTTRIDEESRTVLDPGSDDPSATPDD
jgi:multiple sugar transport system substrate-binding protein